MSDEQYLFISDVRTKKNIAHSASHKVKNYRGATRFPFEYLKGKERKLYMNNSEVTTTNVKTIIPYKEFKKLPKTQRSLNLQYIIPMFGYSTAILGTILGCNQSTAHKLVHELGIKEECDAIYKSLSETERAEARIRYNAFKEAQTENSETNLKVSSVSENKEETVSANIEEVVRVKIERDFYKEQYEMIVHKIVDGFLSKILTN